MTLPHPPRFPPFRTAMAAVVAGAIAAALVLGLISHEQANSLGVLAASFGLVVTRDTPSTRKPDPETKS
mgnify:CR=1 FL=1